MIYVYVVHRELRPANSRLLTCTKNKHLKLIKKIYFQRQDDYEYDESADYGEQDETEAALGLPADSSSIRENIGQAHHMFSRFLNLRICKKIHKIFFVLFFYKAEVFY